MKIDRDHFYFYLGWHGIIVAFMGTVFGRYIDVEWNWSIYYELEDEEV